MLRQKYVVNRNTYLTLQQNVLLFDCLGKYHKWNCYKTWCCRPFKRIVSGAKKYDHVTPLLKSLSWLLVKDQLYYHQAIMAFKCKTSQAPEYLTSQYITREQVSERTARSSLKLNVPLLRTAFGQRTFLLQDCLTLEQFGIFTSVKPICWNFSTNLKKPGFR